MDLFFRNFTDVVQAGIFFILKFYKDSTIRIALYTNDHKRLLINISDQIHYLEILEWYVNR
ncbi:MAG TPA: hypothetical protein VJ552_05345 [Sediminibacterium sp.]|nr:hypothetical protein [Sediminibacterium sp.]